MPCWICPGGGRALPPFWIRFPSATGWTCPNWPGRWRTRLRCSVTAAGCTPIFPRDFFSGANLPNFAHHEYAQAMRDYGYAGLGLMLTLLALFLISGLRSVLKLSGEHQRPNPLGPAAFCVLCIAAFHAYGEFIWHNPALLGASALCGGITCTAPLSRVKASRQTGRWLQATAALLIPYWLCVMRFWLFRSGKTPFKPSRLPPATGCPCWKRPPPAAWTRIWCGATFCMPRAVAPPKPSPAQSIGASGRKSGTPEPWEPRPDGGQKPPLHPPGTPHGSGTAAPPVRREPRQV